MASNKWLPEWVAPAPKRERFPDPLGFQADVDTLADGFLPGIISLTNRARYFSFLCWALSVSKGKHGIMVKLDRQLASREFEKHRDELEPESSPDDEVYEDQDGGKPRCRFRGARFLKSVKSGWLRATTWQIYRSSMKKLGLVNEVGRSNWELTDAGKNLARLYGRNLRRNSHYLPLLCEKDKRKQRERDTLSEILFHKKSLREQMRVFLRQNKVYNSKTALQIALRHHKNCPRSGIERAIWLAAVHELVAIGLNAVFIRWFYSSPTINKLYFKKIPRKIVPIRSLELKVDIRNDADGHVWSFAWARLLAAWDCINKRDAITLQKTIAGKLLFDIMGTTSGKIPETAAQVQELAKLLSERHSYAKGGDLWWEWDDSCSKVVLSNTRVTPHLSRHGYRIDAAISLMQDLR